MKLCMFKTAAPASVTVTSGGLTRTITKVNANNYNFAGNVLATGAPTNFEDVAGPVGELTDSGAGFIVAGVVATDKVALYGKPLPTLQQCGRNYIRLTGAVDVGGVAATVLTLAASLAIPTDVDGTSLTGNPEDWVYIVTLAANDALVPFMLTEDEYSQIDSTYLQVIKDFGNIEAQETFNGTLAGTTAIPMQQPHRYLHIGFGYTDTSTSPTAIINNATYTLLPGGFRPDLCVSGANFIDKSACVIQNQSVTLDANDFGLPAFTAISLTGACTYSVRAY